MMRPAVFTPGQTSNAIFYGLSGSSEQNTLNADPYVSSGVQTGYAFNLGGKIENFSFRGKQKIWRDEHYAAAVDPIPNAQSPPDPQIFHPGDGRSFYVGVTCSW